MARDCTVGPCGVGEGVQAIGFCSTGDHPFCMSHQGRRSDGWPLPDICTECLLELHERKQQEEAATVAKRAKKAAADWDRMMDEIESYRDRLASIKPLVEVVTNPSWRTGIRFWKPELVSSTLVARGWIVGSVSYEELVPGTGHCADHWEKWWVRVIYPEEPELIGITARAGALAPGIYLQATERVEPGEVLAELRSMKFNS